MISQINQFMSLYKREIPMYTTHQSTFECVQICFVLSLEDEDVLQCIIDHVCNIKNDVRSSESIIISCLFRESNMPMHVSISLIKTRLTIQKKYMNGSMMYHTILPRLV